ncbi:hypothetical protein TNCV_73161 [Trichonephila clavipes]|uniref:Uncharacterized protein n=1 Tax=Trichonephila clavipes TaxID=2585209 RepID=A0A8X6UVR9_TRICX|nr:hypothetical protein TNCV_73161 [Trichonephila clavipes]
MISLGQQSLPPADLGLVDEETASTGGQPLHGIRGFEGDATVQKMMNQLRTQELREEIYENKGQNWGVIDGCSKAIDLLSWP